MTRFGRPRAPGFTTAQALQFRRIFRAQAAAASVSFTAIGEAIETANLAVDGVAMVRNALAPSRRLTYRTARVVTVGLLLAIPANATRTQVLAIDALASALYHFGAFARRVPPAFIPKGSIDALATTLAGGGKALRAALRAKLRAQSPEMGQAWVEWMRRVPIKGNSSQIVGFIERTEKLVRAEFPAPYAKAPGPTFSLGREFDVLLRERPDLMQHFLHNLNRAHSMDARSEK